MKLILENWREYLNEATIAMGLCYPFANKMAKEWRKQHIDASKPRGQRVHPDIGNKNKFKVVHGKTTNKWTGESVLHAWVEKGDVIFDYQTHATKPNGIDRNIYYDSFQPEIHNEYTAEEALTNCARAGHHGAWANKQ